MGFSAEKIPFSCHKIYQCTCIYLGSEVTSVAVNRVSHVVMSVLRSEFELLLFIVGSRIFRNWYYCYDVTYFRLSYAG